MICVRCENTLDLLRIVVRKQCRDLWDWSKKLWQLLYISEEEMLAVESVNTDVFDHTLHRCIASLCLFEATIT